jgi:hypothetical protein
MDRGALFFAGAPEEKVRSLGFLARTKKSSFPIWKLHLCPSGVSGWTLIRLQYAAAKGEKEGVVG